MKKSVVNRMKKSLVVLGFVFLLIIVLASSASALFIGITDGYVANITAIGGARVPGATVTVSVSGCSGGASNGCTGSATSDSNGYYIVNNLNLPKLGTVSVSAVKGSGTGSNSGTADNTQVAHVNVTLCYAPSSPTLTPVPDAHTTTATMSWTSGSDPNSLPQHDEFTFDSVLTNPASSPITKIALAFGGHTWSVKTCSNYCCGSSASDSFTLVNSAPSAPTNANFTVHNLTTTLTWVSGSDSDGDPTYDELSYQNGTSIANPATSPYNITSEKLIRWRVRTCDSFGACSSWNDVDAVTCEQVGTTCPACPTCTGGGGGNGGGTGGSSPAPPKKEVGLYCNGVDLGNYTLLRIDMKLNNKNKKISIFAKNKSLEDLEYCPWCYDNIKNYDEDGIDCGGSCRPCAQVEIPVKVKNWLANATAAGIVVAWIMLVYYLFRQDEDAAIEMLKSRKQKSRLDYIKEAYQNLKKKLR